jgi:DNA replication and repair protein RecF
MMFLQRLGLRDYRNYREVEVTLDRGVTVFVGRNGQGKTNLVEALYLLAAGKSHRINSTASLIKKDSETGIVRATVVKHDRALLCEWELNRTSPDRIQMNGNSSKAADLTRALSVVMFAPEDISVIRGDPGLRRAHVDDISGWLFPRIRGSLADYERTLKQRNSLLKSLRTHARADSDTSTLDVWDDKLISLGADIFAARLATLALLQPFVSERYRSIADADHRPHLALAPSVSIAPENFAAYEEVFAEQLRATRALDIDRGQTGLGPHRDDVSMSLNGLPVKGYASHGETWSLALALRLAELDVKRREGPMGDPIVILDDVFAELDTGRRELLSQSLDNVEQVLITAAVRDDVPASTTSRLILISGGAVMSPNDGADS